MTTKIGFACKWIDTPEQVDGVKKTDAAKKYNTGTTTLAWLNRQSRDVAYERMFDLVKQNIQSFKELVGIVAKQDPHLRMVRLSSDCLPMYTEKTYGDFYKQSVVQDYMKRHFGDVGRIAIDNDVKVSFHPGQFTCIVSDNPDIVDSSISELEYHCDMATMMGFGRSDLDCKINTHLSGKRGVYGFLDAFNHMSPTLRSLLTLENDEYQSSLDDLLELSDHVAIVLDIHHHYINSGGEYISNTDSRIHRVVDSWRGVRPTFHYSQSRAEYTSDYNHTLPDLETMVQCGHKKANLRAHSDFYHNRVVNDWALTHLSWGDCMAEAKGKNLAAADLYKQYLGV